MNLLPEDLPRPKGRGPTSKKRGRFRLGALVGPAVLVAYFALIAAIGSSHSVALVVRKVALAVAIIGLASMAGAGSAIRRRDRWDIHAPVPETGRGSTLERVFLFGLAMTLIGLFGFFLSFGSSDGGGGE